MPDRPQLAPLVGGAHALGRIFNHVQMIPASDIHDGIHLARHARVVNHANGPRPLRNGRFNQRLVNILGIRPDIHEHRHRAAQNEGVCGGHKCIGGHDDLVSGSAVNQQGGHFQGGGSGMDEKRFFGACALYE